MIDTEDFVIGLVVWLAVLGIFITLFVWWFK